jgi:hypothetical protein
MEQLKVFTLFVIAHTLPQNRLVRALQGDGKALAGS